MKNRVFSDGSTSQLSKYPSNQQGYGRVDISTFLNCGNTEEPQTTFSVRGGAWASEKFYVSLKETGEEHTYSFVVSNSEVPMPIRVTLVYTDIPAQPGQSPVLINKISMIVKNNESQEAFTRLNSDWEQDNVIVVDILNPLSDAQFVVTIRADSLVGEQAYALVVSGETDSLKDLTIEPSGTVNFLQRGWMISPLFRKLVAGSLLSVLFVAGLADQIKKRAQSWNCIAESPIDVTEV